MTSPRERESPPRGALDPFLDSLCALPRLGRQLVHRSYLPPEPAAFVELAPPLPEVLRQALAETGAERLWSQQAAGIAAVRRGENVLLTTPPASGKSLVLQLPILEQALQGRPGRALLLVPHPELAPDQKRGLDRLAAAAGLSREQAGCEIYGRDTPEPRRQSIRRHPPRVLVVDPESLHRYVLGYAEDWGELFVSLRYLLLPRIHAYSGIFGSHVYHLLARLERLVRLRSEEYEPTVAVATSVAAVNAERFAERLAARRFRVVDDSGAPRGGRHLLLFEPASNPATSALQLLIAFVEAGLKTVVVTTASSITERLCQRLARLDPQLLERLASSGTGLRPEERGEIERQLAGGLIDGFVVTGDHDSSIDVRGLDAAILVGSPGSVMAIGERCARLGGEDRESVTALLARADPLDRYLIEHPDELRARCCEPLLVEPSNPRIARSHLQCAADETPLDRQQDAAYLERHEALIGEMLGRFELAEAAEGAPYGAVCTGSPDGAVSTGSPDGALSTRSPYGATGSLYGALHTLRRRPQRRVRLRGSGPLFEIRSGDELVAIRDQLRVHRECHPGAILEHRGRRFEIVELDPERRRGEARPAADELVTRPLLDRRIEILERLKKRNDGPLVASLGRILVTEWVVGYERRRASSRQLLGRERLELPPVAFETVGLCCPAAPPLERSLERHGHDLLGSLHALEHASIALFPTLALCDRCDLGGLSYPHHPQVGSSAIFLYDAHSGGSGLAGHGFDELPELLARVEQSLERCRCERGCGACIESPTCGNANRPLDKAGALRLVRLLLGEEPAAEVANEAPAASRPAPETVPRAVEPASDPLAPDRQRARPPEPPPDPAGSRSSHRQIERTILFDVETKRSAEEVGGWHRIHRLGVALAVTCNLEENRFRVFLEADVPALVEELRSAELVVGFNVKRFDYRVLQGYTGEDYRRSLPTLDLFDELERIVGFRLGLGHLAQETLGLTKTADGLASLEWYRQGRLELIEPYCRRDVELLRELYVFGRREGFVCFRSRRDQVLKIPVDWE